MKTRVFIGLLIISVGAVVAPAQPQAIPDTEKEAIIRTALDYGDGFYSGSAERMERATSTKSTSSPSPRRENTS
jgi:hypothetical protein